MWSCLYVHIVVKIHIEGGFKLALLSDLLDFYKKAIVVKEISGSLENTRSLSTITKQTTVEPFCIISKDCINLPYISDVNMSLLNIFIAYYLQAVYQLVSLEDVRTRKILKAIGTDVSFSLESNIPSLESIKYSLPGLEADEETTFKNAGVSKNTESLIAPSNLAIGKIIDVQFTLPGKQDKASNEPAKPVSVNVPVIVKMLVNVVGNNAIESLLIRHKEDVSFSERWFSWRAGRISFWSDMVLCTDLINESIRNSISPDNSIVSDVDSRVNTAFLNKLSNIAVAANDGRDPKGLDVYSFGVASNLYVITNTEASAFEYKLGGKLSNPDIREKLFKNGYAMVLAVVDPDRERVKFYVQGADGYTDLSVREIKATSKGKGPDVVDMMKMLQLGTAATF